MSSNLRILIGVAVVVLVAGSLFWFFGRGDGGGVQETAPEVVDAVALEPTQEPEELLSERLKGVTLAGSDTVVREAVAALSSHPEVVVWLANEDLIRRFVASVHMIAEGKSPRSQVDFLKPSDRFSAVERGDGWVVDTASYRRYDLAAQAFAGLDLEGTAQVLTELRPLIDEAHREIAPPGISFDAMLRSAFDRLLAAPVLDGAVAVEPKVVTYTYEDERLEGLAEAEKQLLRMGPENVALVQAKIKEIAEALGL